MTVVATFTVPAAQFPLTRALDAAPSVRIEVDRVLDANGGAVPVFWLFGDDDETLSRAERALSRLDAAAEFTELEALDGQRLCRLTWKPSDGAAGGDLLSRVASGSATVLAARGTADAAELVVRFPDEDAYGSFREWMAAENVPLEEVNEYRPEQGRVGDLRDVDILLTAAENGYLDGSGTIEDVARNVESAADDVATRLRRAQSRVLEAL